MVRRWVFAGGWEESLGEVRVLGKRKRDGFRDTYSVDVDERRRLVGGREGLVGRDGLG